MATRPQGVPADATLIYPGQTFGPGIGVQQLTILSIQAQISSMNARADLNYVHALQDWITNAAIYAGYGMPVPPPPAKPVHITLNVVYADASGNIVPPPAGADGMHYAWVWQTTS